MGLGERENVISVGNLGGRDWRIREIVVIGFCFKNRVSSACLYKHSTLRSPNGDHSQREIVNRSVHIFSQLSAI